MVYAGCVFVAGIHPSGTWMSGSFESVRWNAWVDRLDLGLYSHPKEFWGNRVRTHANSNGPTPLPSIGSSEEDRTYDAASRRTASPPHYWLSYSNPSHLFHDNVTISYSLRGGVTVSHLFHTGVIICSLSPVPLQLSVSHYLSPISYWRRYLSPVQQWCTYILFLNCSTSASFPLTCSTMGSLSLAYFVMAPLSFTCSTMV